MVVVTLAPAHGGRGWSVADHGKVLYFSTLKQNKPTEHVRVLVLGGGEPHDSPVPLERKHGKVLFQSSRYSPDLRFEGRTNVAGNRPTERVGSVGGFQRGVDIRAGGVPRDIAIDDEADHGTVLFTSSKWAPDMSCEGSGNVAGGRPGERHGSCGGFGKGSTVWGGGKPRDVPVKPARPLGTVTVLYTSESLVAVDDDEVELDERGDRHNSGHGAFTHGVVLVDGGQFHRDMPMAEEWAEAGQTGSRRNGQGHFQAGVTVLGGGMPSYNSPDN